MDASLLLTLDDAVTGAGILSHSGPAALQATVNSSVNATTLSGDIVVEFQGRFQTVAFVEFKSGNVTSRTTRELVFSNRQKIVTRGTSSQLVDVQQHARFRASAEGSFNEVEVWHLLW